MLNVNVLMVSLLFPSHTLRCQHVGVSVLPTIGTSILIHSGGVSFIVNFITLFFSMAPYTSSLLLKCHTALTSSMNSPVVPRNISHYL